MNSPPTNVRFARADGLDLPVIDLTHPAFDFDLGVDEVRAVIDRFLEDARKREKLPRFLERLVVGIFLRQSLLARGLRRGKGSFVAGLDTYLFKMGPDFVVGPPFAPVDRAIASSLPAVSMRLRLLDVSRLLAKGIAPALEARRGPLALYNLGGGPAADSWNALLLTRRDRPELLWERPCSIRVVDLSDAAPTFGARAVEALAEAGGPLDGVQVSFTYERYDWARPATLGPLLANADDDAVVAVSSEGALFEYATDDVVRANLEAIHAHTPADAVVAGSVTSDSELARLIGRDSRITLRPRSEEAFASLARSAGWAVVESIDRPICRDVLLRKR